ncbi:hypothetical protein JN01_0084 [Entomoplasma freundtii]|uniref:Hydrolase n=1 Tax=Entomoplasma freundtii TaxID=74700 RepID=A0A2K8NSG6_9MOLU|nr:alpha/beta hydrolase [Entomoplasma freundtii]ATZ16694.1 hydrolase [Entomoplasma freundtii]TDY58139.1 hypothetical protein JN01_0084 [Entomoplasma freundtii]
MRRKQSENVPKVPTSDQDLVYNFPILWKTLWDMPQIKVLSTKSLVRFNNVVQDYLRDEGMRQRKAAYVEVDTIADYVDDSFARGLNQYNFLYTADDLKKLDEVVILNPDGQKLQALILRNNRSKKWVIALHGWTENKFLGLRQTYLFSKLGFNVMTIDVRAHGASYGTKTDLGYSAPYDLASCVDYLKTHYGMTNYGLIGNSMGGSIVVKYAEDIGYLDPALKFVIDDCGFSNLLLEARYFFQRQTKMPWWKVSFGLRRKFKKVFGYDPNDFDIRKKLSRTAQIPMLFLHGDADDLVPLYMSEQLYKEKIASEQIVVSELIVFPKAKHVEAISVGHKQYVNGIVQFLKKIGEIK